MYARLSEEPTHTHTLFYPNTSAPLLTHSHQHTYTLAHTSVPTEMLQGLTPGEASPRSGCVFTLALCLCTAGWGQVFVRAWTQRPKCLYSRIHPFILPTHAHKRIHTLDHTGAPVTYFLCASGTPCARLLARVPSLLPRLRPQVHPCIPVNIARTRTHDMHTYTHTRTHGTHRHVQTCMSTDTQTVITTQTHIA